MQRNEYLFGKAAICTTFGAICGKMYCNLPQNAVRFGAKCSAFGAKRKVKWCKMQCKMLQNAR